MSSGRSDRSPVPREQAISDEVLGEERIAFAFIVTLLDGRHYIEHVILHLVDGKITRQVDVEAWD